MGVSFFEVGLSLPVRTVYLVLRVRDSHPPKKADSTITTQSTKERICNLFSFPVMSYPLELRMWIIMRTKDIAKTK